MVQKITLMEAYLIEIIRSNGITNEEIISKVQKREMEDFQYLHEQFDFRDLYKLADQGIHVLEKVLKDGYQVKYLTFSGLVNLLKLKFAKMQDRDYEVHDFVVSKLQLCDNEMVELTQILSPNWCIEYTGEGIIINPKYDV